MSALFGFTGPPNEKLLQHLRQQLHHRGPKSQAFAQSPTGSLGMVTEAEAITAARWQGGCHQAKEPTGQTINIAWAGYFLGEKLTGDKLLGRYRKQGIDFVAGLNGAFVLAVQEGKTLHLARDGAGVRTAYYVQHQGRLLFASEPKALWSLPGFSRRLRPAAVAEYLTFSFIPGDQTMLELPAGHILSIDENNQPQLKRFFTFEVVNSRPVQSDEQWVQQFRNLFTQAVAERMPPSSPVVFLSGGLDSSVVTAEVARQSTQPVQTFAIHFGPKYPHELDFARAVAQRCGTQHEEVLIEPRDFLPRLRQMIWHLDEPIGDPITMPNFELSRRVAGRCGDEGSGWVFNGEGGDPLFGGPKNIPMLLHHWYGGVPRDERFRERLYLASYRRGYEELERLLSPELRAQIKLPDALESLLTPYFAAPHPSGFLDKLSVINIRMKGAHLILPKVERMYGAAGLTALCPLYDERLIRFSFEMPSYFKLHQGSEKVILKRAFAELLPPEVITRPKSGMRVPVHFWFQGEMRSYVQKILSPRSLRKVGLFDPERVAQLLAYDITEGPGRYGLRLWMLLTLEIWRRLVIEGESV